jgi:hypothetical protein
MTRTSLTAAVCLATLIAFALTSSNGTASGGPVSVSDLAPADEYFGRLRLSPLGIRHKIFSLKDDLHHARSNPDAIQHDASLIEDALQDWIRRFPRDPWLPATAWNLATLYEELPGTIAQTRAVAMLQTVRDRFADTTYADDAARDLARGVGVRPWPKWAQHESDDADSLVASILALSTAPDAAHGFEAAKTLEMKYWTLSRNGDDPAFARSAWELAVAYEKLPGEEARSRAIRLLALLVDRHSSLVYGRWALRDLERGIGERS